MYCSSKGSEENMPSMVEEGLAILTLSEGGPGSPKPMAFPDQQKGGGGDMEHFSPCHPTPHLGTEFTESTCNKEICIMK